MEFPIQAEYDLVESVEVRCFGEDLTFYLIITLSDGNCITYDIKSYSCGYDNSYLEIKYSDDETKAKAEQERIESLEKFKREKQEKAKETRIRFWMLAGLVCAMFSMLSTSPMAWVRSAF